MDTTELELDLSDLRDDGDTLELPDGTMLRLRIEPDNDTTPFDSTDTYGKVEWYDDRRAYDNYGYSRRPNGFDGNAEKIDMRDGRVWWQPPADVKRTDEGFPALRRLVLDLLEYGYSIVILEHLDGIDAYHRPIVHNVVTLGAVEPVQDPKYLATIVSELYHELMDEVGHDYVERYFEAWRTLES